MYVIDYGYHIHVSHKRKGQVELIKEANQDL